MGGAPKHPCPCPEQEGARGGRCPPMPGRHRALTSELQGGVLDPLLQAFHGLHQLLVELLYDLVQQTRVLEPSPEGKGVICERRSRSESRKNPQSSRSRLLATGRRRELPRGLGASVHTVPDGGLGPGRSLPSAPALPPEGPSGRPARPAPCPRGAPPEGPVPPMAVVQSPGSSQVSMVMVAGDPFTATQTRPP